MKLFNRKKKNEVVMSVRTFVNRKSHFSIPGYKFEGGVVTPVGPNTIVSLTSEDDVVTVHMKNRKGEGCQGVAVISLGFIEK